MAEVKYVLVTGGNKGIGFAIVEGLLRKGCFVFLGSRDVPRGEEAANALSAEYRDRVQVVQLDVTDASSIAGAVGVVKARCGAKSLYGLMNNAGGGDPTAEPTHEFNQTTIELNFDSVVRVTIAFLPLLSSNGRIVMVSSGAAPTYVSKCSDTRKTVLCDPGTTLKQVRALLADAEQVSASRPEDPQEAFGAVGLAGDGVWVYGMSKAAVTAYAMILARENPALKINSCSPGLVDTDLTKRAVAQMGKSAEELGIKTPKQGASCPLYLMLGDVPTPPGEAWFFGSDSVRSPLDKYREPGEPPYTGGVSKESAHSMDAVYNSKL